MVHDDLTGKVVKLLEILDSKTHTNGLIVDSEHLEGYRHPWEVSEVRKMTKAILVSKTMVDENYIEQLIEENPPEDIKDLEFYRNLKNKPEQLMIYIARVSSPQQSNPSYEKLLKYCWDHGHISVFEQISCTMEVETDLNVAAQLLRHGKGFNFQQLSRRYSSDNIDFVEIKARRQDTKNRQNSIDDLPSDVVTKFLVAQHMLQMHAKKNYDEFIALGVSKECCRYLLPTSLKTKIYVTGPLRSWLHYVNTRSKPESQKEHRDLALAIQKQLITHFPVTSSALGWK
jgi:thymidylate synthase (FAD)